MSEPDKSEQPVQSAPEQPSQPAEQPAPSPPQPPAETQKQTPQETPKKEKQLTGLSPEEIEEKILKFRKNAEKLLSYSIFLVAITYTFLGIESLWLDVQWKVGTLLIAHHAFFLVLGIFILIIGITRYIPALDKVKQYILGTFAIVLGVYFIITTLIPGLGVTNFLVVVTGVMVILVGIMMFVNANEYLNYINIIGALGALFLGLNVWASAGSISYLGINWSLEGAFFFALAIGLGLSAIITKEAEDIKALFFIVAAFIYGISLIELSVDIYQIIIAGRITGAVLPAPVGEFFGVITGFIIIINIIYFLLDIAYQFEVRTAIKAEIKF